MFTLNVDQLESSRAFELLGVHGHIGSSRPRTPTAWMPSSCTGSRLRGSRCQARSESSNSIGAYRRPTPESLETVRRRFRMGRLYGLRGEVVHHGLQPPIDGRLLKYLAAVYCDVLRHELGLPPIRTAEEVLNRPDAKEWWTQ